MRVLHYNWVDTEDPAGNGGGVRVYQKAVLDELGLRPSVSSVFLSAGLAQDIVPRPVRWEKLGDGTVPRYRLVNSAPHAPSHHSFGEAAQLSHAKTEAAFERFLNELGPFDVVHFNNLEGLPATVLEIAARRHGAKVVLSLHNHYVLCPQVNLWFQEDHHCADFDGGRACVDCLPFRPSGRQIRTKNAVLTQLDRVGLRPGKPAFDRTLAPALRSGAKAVRSLAAKRRARRGGALAELDPDTRQSDHPALESKAQAAKSFAARRTAFVDAINQNCARVLCVSDRMRVIAANHGIDASLLEVDFIGSDHADRFSKTRPSQRLCATDGQLTLAYLGYMRRDKGFFFLVDALLALPTETAKRIRLVLAAGAIGQPGLEAVAQLRAHMGHVEWFDGYRREELDSILDGVDLGVIPVLWEDSMPQVALEMHARRIPLVTSHRGGARELGNCKDLVFEAGNTVDFAHCLDRALSDKVDMKAYWKGARVPTDLAEHVDRLLETYRQL